MYQLIRYSDDKMSVLGEYDNLTPFCSVIPKLCPDITSLFTRETLIRDVIKALEELNPYISVNDFINTHKDELSIAAFDDFTYAVQFGERMLLLTGDYESPTIDEINAIFRFCHRNIKYHGSSRPKYKVINMQLAK